MAKTSKKFKEDLKGMKAEDLKKRLLDMRGDLRKLLFKMEGSRSKNVKEEWALKKNIARVLTAMNAK